MNRAIRVTVLVAVMAVKAYGGDMQNGVVAPPPPPAPSSSQMADGSRDAEFETDGYMQDGVAETVAEVSLNLLQTLLALI